MNVEPSPSLDPTAHLAFVVAGDVAHDRQTESGSTGFAAARPIDPVEPFEDPLEVAAGDADAVIVDLELDNRRSVRARTSTVAVLVGVLHRVVEEVGRRPRPTAGDRR